MLNKADNKSIGGIKLVTEQGWAAIRPSGTENICKVYTEGFNGQEHLKKLQDDALALLNRLLQTA
jgi:phosphoglucomutase